jgi:hypothetical protein
LNRQHTREQCPAANIEAVSSIDPTAARKSSAATTVVVTFGDLARDLIVGLKRGWKMPSIISNGQIR